MGIVIPGIARAAGAGADVAGMFFPGMPGSLAAAGGVVMSIPGMDCVAAGLAAVLGEVEGPPDNVGGVRAYRRVAAPAPQALDQPRLLERCADETGE